MSSDFQIRGTSDTAPFTLKIHRGDGMALLAMNWRHGEPPADFVGFAIEYREPGGDKFYALKNRLGFLGADGKVNPKTLSTLQSPIQKFRWVHFPRNAELDGDFLYRVTPVFMNERDELSLGEPQQAAIELRRDTYPGVLNVSFTRGFVSSQGFVDKYVTKTDGLKTLLPRTADGGLTFVPTHPKAVEALEWMGFEARRAILSVLDEAVADTKAQVRVVAYDLNEPDVVSRLERLGPRLRMIIDDSDAHGEAGSAETQAFARLSASAGAANVRRQHMGKLQHNKTIVVNGPKVKAAVCGSTNFSWRGFFVQSNNAVVLRGSKAVNAFMGAFDNYWANSTVAGFGASASAQWINVSPGDVNLKLAFSPHTAGNALLASVAADVASTKSSLFYSLAFLYQTPGVIRDAIELVTKNDQRFVYGISDRKVGGGLDLLKPDGNHSPVYPASISGDLPEPFKSEPSGLSGGVGTRMHHKFIVIDFDKPTARVYLGSYNFSVPADVSNGENLLLIRNRRIAVSYMVEALRTFDHYHFRVNQQQAATKRKVLHLWRPPRKTGEVAWWKDDYTDPRRIMDRELFD
ncbi:MAG TPA: phospholipase D-like domain-containing protein [Vicinamibacterales bacterium]|nr:phospholipase D-like domain-containing protein [Vicinamibacterales bacterium]